MRRFVRRLWYLVRQRSVEAALSEELAQHRALAERDLTARGLPPPEAAPAARRALGNVTLARDEARDVWMWAWLQDLSQDVRIAARVLARDRRFTLASVLALALGIGVTNSVFTLVNAALLRDLPFDRPDRLVALRTVDRNGSEMGVSYLDYRDWQGASHSLTGLGASSEAVMNISEEGRAPERFRGAYVTANAFGLLRSEPLLGRAFLAGDERPGAPAVALLAHAVWISRYASDPGIVGRTIRVNDVPSTVVGVMPAGFKFPLITEVWQPLAGLPGLASARRDDRVLDVFARLADGVDAGQARAELDAVVARLQAHRGRDQALRSSVRPLKEAYGGGSKPMLMTFMGAVGFVLLIACANVANLLLARAARRSREIAIRASLGATRWRIVRQLLVECAVLAALAGVLGAVLSVYGSTAIAVAFSPLEPGVPPGATTPFWLDLSIDGSTLAFLSILCLAASLAFGLVPALLVSRTNVNAVINEGGRSGAGSLRTRRWTGAFIVAELALTVVLLAGAGLLWRSFFTLSRTNLVIDTAGLVTMQVALPAGKYGTPEARARFFERLDSRLGSIPLFSSATVASGPPLLSSFGSSRRLSIEGRTPLPEAERPEVLYVYAGARYFDTLGLRLVRGRPFPVDGSAGRDAAIVNQRFASMFLPDQDPVGHRIRLRSENEPGAEAPWLTIVGVAPTLPHFAPSRPSEPEVYVPLGAEPAPGPIMSILVRGGAGVAAATRALREEVRALDPNLPLYGIEPMDEALARARLPQRLVGSWFGVIAFIALVLASVGVYALTAHGVAQRAQEIGIRMALGAPSSQVMWLFLRGTVMQLAAGLALGLGGALALGRLLEALLFQTSAADALTLVSVVALLTTVSIVASVVPARRAARLDPIAALRRD